VAILRVAKVHTYNDTITYAHRGGGLDHGQLVSLVGDAPRFWGTPAFFALFPTDPMRADGQWLLSTVAWALFAATLWLLLRTAPAKVLASGTVLVFALMAPVTSWDFAILSESLSVSLGVIVLSCFLLWARTGSRVALVAMTLAGVWWTFTRPDIRVMLPFVCLGLVWFAWRDRRRRRQAIASLALLVLGLGWCTAIGPRMETALGRWSTTGMPMQHEMMLYKLMQVYRTPYLQKAYEDDLGMPACPAAEAKAKSLPPEALYNGVSGVALANEYKSCSELKAWVDEHGQAFQYRLPFVAPGAYAAITRSVLPDAFSVPSFYGGVPFLFPQAIERIVFPKKDNVLGVLFGGWAVALAVAVAAGAWRRHRLLLATALIGTACALATHAVTLLVSATEFGRVGVQESLLFRLCVLLLLVVALDTTVQRLRDRRAVGSADSGSGQPDSMLVGSVRGQNV
jgi:hypothetical protein